MGPDGIKWELPTFELEKWNSVYHTVHSNVSYELSTSKKGIKEQVLIEKLLSYFGKREYRKKAQGRFKQIVSEKSHFCRFTVQSNTFNQ